MDRATDDGDPEHGVPTVADRADALAAQLLGCRRTKLGGLHIDHARRVAARAGPDARLVAAALLHDVLEKTDTTAAELRAAIGDDWVVDLVEVLTQQDGEPDLAYLRRCAARPDSVHLKRLDLGDKFDDAQVEVSADRAATLRHQAATRLALLDGLTTAPFHPVWGRSALPDGARS